MAKLGLDRYKIRPTEHLYIALEELDFSWRESEIADVVTMWTEGYHIADIAKKLSRKSEEVFVMLMDLAMRDKIEYRIGSVRGCRE